MSDEKKVHPLRRKHRRGKRGGKKHRVNHRLPPDLVFLDQTATLHTPVTIAPEQARSLRARLTALSRKAG